MPNTASAAKQARASVRRRQRNLLARAKVRSAQKKFLAALGSGKKDEATSLYPQVVSVLDKAAKRGIIHAHTASRKKSRYQALLKAAA